jgi:transposase
VRRDTKGEQQRHGRVSKIVEAQRRHTCVDADCGRTVAGTTPPRSTTVPACGVQTFPPCSRRPFPPCSRRRPAGVARRSTYAAASARAGRAASGRSPRGARLCEAPRLLAAREASDSLSGIRGTARRSAGWARSRRSRDSAPELHPRGRARLSSPRPAGGLPRDFPGAEPGRDGGRWWRVLHRNVAWSGAVPGTAEPRVVARSVTRTPCEPPAHASSGGRPPALDPETYKQHNVVERAINKLKAHRAVATRYDKRDYTFRGTIDLASIRIWLRDPLSSRAGRRSAGIDLHTKCALLMSVTRGVRVHVARPWDVTQKYVLDGVSRPLSKWPGTPSLRR